MSNDLKPLGAFGTALLESETKASLVSKYLDAREALKAMLSDYRSEGCVDATCRVCARSNAAQAKAIAVLKFNPKKE